MSQKQNLDTRFTKIHVGGLPWKTREEGLISFFKSFGEITHAKVILDRATNRSQGYGFVTFRDPESATRACMNPNPLIEGRIANCKLAHNGATVVNQSPSNIISLPPDDLCFVPYWNQIYHQQYYQQYYDFSQHYYYPQYYDPVFYQQYDMVNTNQWYWPHDPTNTVN